MEDKNNRNDERKKSLKRILPFLCGCAFLIVIAVTILASVSRSTTKNNNSPSTSQTKEVTGTEDSDKQIVAVLKEIKETDSTMTLMDIETGQDLILNYTGGTNFVDKYDQVILPLQLKIGEMVDAYYTSDSAKLVKLQISNLAWEYQGVNNWSIDPTTKIFQIVDSKYKYSQDTVVIREGEFLDIQNLNNKDELTIKGYEKDIWSIIVTKGHGTLKFEDYSDFIGGTAYIGNDEIIPIVADMVITVQEGSYTVNFENGSLKGTKQVSVGADEEVIVNMGEFKNPVAQTGLVNFSITPEGAELYIDDTLQDYDKAVKLEYGQHTIKVTLGGYSDYSGDLDVNEATTTLSVNLVESQSSDSTTNTQEDTTSTDNSTSNQNNTTTQDDNSSTNSNNNTNSNTNTEDTTDSSIIDPDKNIYVNGPEGASVYFNEEFKGSAPVSFPKVTGSQYIILIRSGYETVTYTVEIADDGKDVYYNFPAMVKSE